MAHFVRRKFPENTQINRESGKLWCAVRHVVANALLSRAIRIPDDARYRFHWQHFGLEQQTHYRTIPTKVKTCQ
jgi:hypothetical protein